MGSSIVQRLVAGLNQYNLRQKRRRNPDTLSLEILTPETALAFLHHLEQTRGNAIRTRNARLAALRSFVHYLVDWIAFDPVRCCNCRRDRPRAVLPSARGQKIGGGRTPRAGALRMNL